MGIINRLFLTLLVVSFLVVPLTWGQPPASSFNPKSLPADLKWISVGGIPFIYSDQGKGEPLVIFSPYPFSTRFWTDFTKYLTRFARVIIVEPPGLRDPATMKGDFSSEHLLHMYRKFVRELGVGKVHVLGVGESGAMAVAFGHHFPEDTGTVVSINGFESVHWTKEFEQTMYFFQQTFRGGLGSLIAMGSTKYGKRPPSPKVLESWLVPLPDEMHQAAVEARFTAYSDDVKMGYILGMIPYVDRPLLILRPEKDQLLSNDFHKRTQSQIRKVRVRYQTIPEASHFAFLDQPQKISELVRGFHKIYPIE